MISAILLLISVASQAPATIPNTQRDFTLPATRLRLEEYRLDLETVNQDWEAFRRLIESKRKQTTLPFADYQSLLDSYTQGIHQYRQGINDYRAFQDVQTAAARQEVDQLAASRIIASQATIADAKIKLADAEQRASRDVSQLSRVGQLAMLESFSGDDSAAIRAYVRDRFPKPKPGEPYEPYSAKVNAFSADLMARTSSDDVVNELTVSSAPLGAKVRLHPKYDESVSRTGDTQAVFPNLRIGLYIIIVSVKDYQDYRDEFNWLEDLRPNLNCACVDNVVPKAISCTRAK